MIVRKRIKCKCHKVLVRTENTGTKAFPQKKYYCTITGDQLYNDFIHEKSKVDLRDPDDTWPGNDMSPADTDEAIEDFKKRQGGDE